MSVAFSSGDDSGDSPGCSKLSEASTAWDCVADGAKAEAGPEAGEDERDL